MTQLTKTTIRTTLGNCPSCVAIGFSDSFIMQTKIMSKDQLSLDDMDCSSLLVGIDPLKGTTLRLKLGNTDLPCKSGVSVILGPAASGKTTLLKRVLLVKNPDEVTYISHGEPDIESTISQASFFNAILDAPTEVIVCDSIRRWFFDSRGSTGKGGVNMSLFMVLTAWDLLAKATGKHIIFVLNPLSTDDDAIGMYIEAAKGAVSMVLHATSPGILHVTGRFMATRDFRDVRYELPPLPNAQSKVNLVDQDTVIADFMTSEIGDLYALKNRKRKG